MENRSRIVALVVGLFMILPGAFILAETAAAPNVVLPENVGRGAVLDTIHLRMASFDPLVDGPGVGPEFRTNVDNGYYILQLNDGLSSWADRQLLVESGVEFLGYLGSRSWVVEMSPSLRPMVESLDMTRWIGVYQPGWKIDPDVRETSGTNLYSLHFWDGMFSGMDYQNLGREMRNMDYESRAMEIVERGYIEMDGEKLDIGGFVGMDRLFDSVDELYEQLSKALDRWQHIYGLVLEDRGLTVVDWDLDTPMPRVIVEADATEVLNAASLNAVKWIDVVHTEPVRHLTNVQREEYGGLSNTGARDGGFDGSGAMGMGGSNVVGGHHDVGGPDQNNPALEDNIANVYGNYDGDSHMTGCIGTTIGYDYGTLDGNRVGTAPSYNRNHYWNAMTADYASNFYTAASVMAGDGGRIISRSWGWAGTDNSRYTTYSVQNDNAVNDFDVVYFVSAGNSVYVSEDAMGKNYFAVGGIQQAGTATLSDDTYDTGASRENAVFDNRVKPEISAPFAVTTVLPGGGTGATQGTSFSAPHAAGTAVILLDMLQNGHLGVPIADPHSSLIRAMVIATAFRLESDSGDMNRVGWGQARSNWAYELADNVYYDEHISLEEGESWSRSFDYSGIAGPYGEGIQIAIAWNDPSGQQVSGGRALFNDLDLRVTDDLGNVYYGNLGMGTNRWTQHTGQVASNEWDIGADGAFGNQYTDDVNTIEAVFLPHTTTIGRTYTVEVLCDEINSGNTQSFSIFVANVAGGMARMHFGDYYTNPEWYHRDHIGSLTVIDADLNVNAGVEDTGVVTLTSDRDPVGIELTVTETGPNTNVFVGEFQFGRPSADGTNSGESNPNANPPILAVNSVDTVVSTYTDVGLGVDIVDFCYYDEVPPTLLGVTISEVSTVGARYRMDFDERSLAYIMMPYVQDSNMAGEFQRPANEDEVRDVSIPVSWYLATTEEYIRAYNFFSGTGGADAFEHAYGTYRYSHDYTTTFAYSGESYLTMIYAEDRSWNYAIFDNGGEYYRFTTQEQPFKILNYYDGGGDFFGLAGMLAGYDVHAFYNEIIEDQDVAEYPPEGGIWNPDLLMHDYYDPYLDSTIGDYWTQFIQDNNNVLIWGTGFFGIDINVWFEGGGCAGPCAGGGGEGGTEVIPLIEGWTITTDGYYMQEQGGYPGHNQASQIRAWRDAGGKSWFDGAGMHEDAGKRGAMLTVFQDDFHSNRENSGGADQTTPIGWDVTANYLILDGDGYITGFNDGRAQVSMVTNLAAPVGSRFGRDPTAFQTDSYFGDWLLDTDASGNQISPRTAGAEEELGWGVDMDNNNIAHSAGVSYENAGTGEKTLLTQAGLVGTDFYFWLRGDNNPGNPDHFSEIEAYTAAVLDWMAPDPLRITGQVVDAGSNPVEGASISVYAQGDKSTVLAGAVTDASGNYEVVLWSSGTYDLYATKTFYTEDSNLGVVVTADVSGINFVISDQVGNIGGTVYLEDGVSGRTELTGARVTAYAFDDAALVNPIAHASSNAAGNYYLGDLPLDNAPYTLKFSGGFYIKPDYYYTSIGPAYAEDVAVSHGSTTTFDKTLYSGGITGYVYEDDGVTPVADAYVFAVEYGYGPAWSNSHVDDMYSISYAFTDADGSYSMTLLSDNSAGTYGPGYVVTASADGRYRYSIWNSQTDSFDYYEQAYGYENQSYNNKHMSDGGGLSPNAVSVSGVQMTTGINFNMRSVMATITGTVYLPDGTTPAPGARVTAVLNGPEYMVGNYGTTKVVYTNLDGVYSMDVVGGIDGTATYVVSASKSPYIGVDYNNGNPFGVSSASPTTGVNMVLVEPEGGAAVPGGTFLFIQDNDDNPPDGVDAWLAGLDSYEPAGGFSYDHWHTHNVGRAPTAGEMDAYDVVVWMVGNLWESAQMYLIDNEASLRSYLDGGGAVLLSGQDAPWAGLSDNYITNYGGIGTIEEDVGPPTTLTGINNHPITDGINIDYQKLIYDGQPFEDRIWGGAGEDMFAEPYGVNYDAGTFKTVTWFWCYEDVGDARGRQLLHNTFDWLSAGESNTPPVLFDPQVTPVEAGAGTTFTWSVVYADADGDAPEYVRVTINADTYDMVKITPGTNWEAGILYEYSMVLNDEGVHSYNFSARDTNVEFGPRNAAGDLGPHSGPTVTDSTPPVLTHDYNTQVGYISGGIFVAATEFAPEQNIRVYAEATDNIGVTSVRVYYNGVDSVDTYVSMSLSGNQANPDEYVVTIPGQASQGTVTYYVEARDAAGNTARVPASGTYTLTIGEGGTTWLPIGDPVHSYVLSGSGDHVALSWDHVEWGTNVDGFHVYRSTDKTGGWTQIGTDVAALTFSDNNMWADGNSYYYMVVPKNPDYTGPDSELWSKATISLGAGSNLVNWRDLDLDYDAANGCVGVRNEIEAQNPGVTVLYIDRWTGTGWARYNPASPFSPTFPMYKDQGYMIGLSDNAANGWKISARVVASPSTIALAAGSNLVSAPMDYDAANGCVGVRNEIEAQNPGVTVLYIDRWTGTGWARYNPASPFSPTFPMYKDQGYMIGLSDNAANGWTVTW